MPGGEGYLNRLEGAEVRYWWGCESHCGSIEFNRAKSERRPYKLPVEGRLTDLDGVPVEILLFGRADQLDTLEFVVFTDHIKHTPQVAEIEVII
jgi:hypothetical protein